MHEFRKLIIISRSFIRKIIIFQYYHSKTWWTNTASQPRDLNLQQVWKPSISYLRFFYFVQVLYEKLEHMLVQRYETCITKRKMVFKVSSLEFHSIKKGILFTYIKRNIVSLYNVIFMRVYLVCWCTRHNYNQRQWLWDLQCHTYRILHLQSNKLVV